MAILWHELWHEGLEEASRLYFTERNPEGMVAVLEPLHDMVEAVCSPPIPQLSLNNDILSQGPTTTREISFVQAYGRDLHEAREACRAYTSYGETGMLDKAWDIYYGASRSNQRVNAH